MRAAERVDAIYRRMNEDIRRIEESLKDASLKIPEDLNIAREKIKKYEERYGVNTLGSVWQRTSEEYEKEIKAYKERIKELENLVLDKEGLRETQIRHRDSEIKYFKQIEADLLTERDMLRKKIEQYEKEKEDYQKTSGEAYKLGVERTETLYALRIKESKLGVNIGDVDLDSVWKEARAAVKGYAGGMLDISVLPLVVGGAVAGAGSGYWVGTTFFPGDPIAPTIGGICNGMLGFLGGVFGSIGLENEANSYVAKLWSEFKAKLAKPCMAGTGATGKNVKEDIKRKLSWSEKAELVRRPSKEKKLSWSEQMKLARRPSKER